MLVATVSVLVPMVSRAMVYNYHLYTEHNAKFTSYSLQTEVMYGLL